MDAKQIYECFRKRRASFPALLQDGPTLTQIRVRKVIPSGLVVTGSYIPRLNSIVNILVKHYSAQGIVTVRTDIQCSIKFLRPFELDEPY
jgi:hypothetical protein